MYTAEVESFTHKKTNQVIVAKKFLSAEDHVLIIDDFLSIIDSMDAESGTIAFRK